MSSSFSMPSKPVTILADATSGFRNNVRRMRSRTIWDQPRTNITGKENHVSGANVPYLHLTTVPDVFVARNTPRSPSARTDRHKWAPVNGMIIIKVYVPITDDLWRLKVPEDVSLSAFHQKVEAKVGFPVVLGLSQSDTFSDAQFQQWVGRRVRNGRNMPLTARPAWMVIKNPPLL